MKYRVLLLCFFSFALLGKSQEITCENSFTPDTISIPGQTAVMEGDKIETTTKNQSVIQLFAVNRTKFYIRMYVKENFYFNKVDVLEVESGSKSYYVKNSKQFKINKTTGMYVFEVQRNYMATLREEGITGLIFAGAETKFTRTDGKEIRKMCDCFYETYFGKK